MADVRTGAARFVPCEVVVFTGDWIPDHELARLAGLAMDPGTRGPAVDTTLATSAPGVFAAGNLVHAAETADIAALSGRHAARHIAAPTLLIHGDRDTTVSVEQSRAMVAANPTIRLRIVTSAGHHLSRAQWDSVWPEAVAFLCQT